MNNEFELIMAIVNRGDADDAMNAAKLAGATGGTILHGRGTGGKEALHFYGISVKEEKELLLIVTKRESKNEIMSAIVSAGNLTQSGAGITFSLPVSQVVGINKRNETPFALEVAPEVESDTKTEKE